LSNNSFYGITLFDISKNNNIWKNTICDNNLYGIEINTNAEDNFIEWNNFIGNNAGNIQANDAGSSNSFINNYWDDFTSPDQNPTDGFVDNPYNIDGGSNTDPISRAYPYSLHSPINITNASDFDTKGFSGNGTVNNPYLIEEYYIINSTNLISIKNAFTFFTVRNCILNGMNSNIDGISLNLVSNGAIEQNIIVNSQNGI
jgi:nitrous oxidase accessory protein NosD